MKLAIQNNTLKFTGIRVFYLFSLLVFTNPGLFAQSTQTFSYTTPTVTSDNTGGFVDALTIDVPTSAFPADYVTTDVNVVINYDKTAGSCGSPGTGNSYHNEHGFQLESPVSTQATIFDPGQFSGATNITPGVTQTFDDASATAIPGGVPASGTYRPNNSFSAFNNQDPEGTWTLRASETANGDPLCIISVDIVITAENLPSPGNVSTDIALWLKANAGITTSGSDVIGWNDQSGNGHNYVNGTEEPTLATAEVNFNDVVSYSTTTDAMTTTNNTYNDWTFYSVVRGTDLNNRSSLLFTSDLAIRYEQWFESGKYGITPFSAGSLPNPADYQSTIDNHVDKVEILSYSHSSSSNNVSVSTITSEGVETTDIINTTATNRPLGIENLGDRYSGIIGEFIVYNNASVNPTDEQKIETYLAIKYGITLPKNYLSSNGTTIYDISGGTYITNIAGIGKEDNQGLNQSKSHSVNDDATLTVTAPSDLSDGEYLVWGSNNLTGTTTSDLPAGYDERLNNIWFFRETGDVGTVSMKFDLGKLGDRSSDPNDYALLINHTTASFASPDETVTNGASISDNILTFTNVPIQNADYISLAVSAVKGPGAVSSGMKLWLKANVVTEVTELLVQVVGLWDDQSGFGNHADTEDLNSPQVETSSTLNNNTYLNFADNSASESPLILPSISNTSSFITVVRTSTNGTDIFERDANTTPMLEVEGGVYRGNSDAGFVSTTSTGNWNITGLFNASSTDHRIYVNGGLEDTDANAITIPASTGYNLFTNFTGEVAEVVYYENMLTDTERRQVESYLAIKYGITLDLSTQNYLDGTGATILDRTVFTSYSNNIAGIGKADANSGNNAQGLSQTQSRSINNTGIVTINNASDLNDGEYLLWGSNNATALASLSESTPTPAISGVNMTLDRKWKIAETGDVGTVTISFDLSSVSSVSDRELASYSLVIDDTENMGSPTSILKPTSVSSNVITFENVSFSNGEFFVLGTAVSAAPGNVSSNLSLWFKAGAGVSTSGSDVTSWVDQSPTGLDLNSRNSAPTINSGAINSNDAVAFDGNDNIYNSGTYNTEDLLSGGTLTGQHTFYIVAQHSLSNPSTRNVFFSNGSDQFRQGLHSNPRVHIRESSSANNNISPGSVNVDNPNIYVIKRTTNNTTGGGTLYVNGTTVSNYNTGNGVTDDTKIVLGGENDSNGSNGWVGNIAEVIAFATSEDDTDRQKIETYLAIKYGITLTNNYIATDGTTVVYNVANGYANDIAGIGRDDDELLAQTQSKSENNDAIITMSNASDLSDKEYLIWGNNDGATSETATGLPSGVNQMLTRKWSVSETGDVQGVQIQFDLTGLTVTGSAVADFSLIVDGDGTFNDGDEVLFTADNFSSNVVTFNNIDLSNGAVFSLATSVSSNLVEIASSVGDYEVTSSCPVISGSSYIDVRDANNRLVYSINPNGNNLGATCWGVRIRTSGSASDDLVDNENYFLDRNFYITPTTQPSSDVSIRFYVLNDEIDDIRSRLTADGKSSGNDVTEYLQDFLRVTKQDGEDLNPLTSDGLGTSQVFTPTVTAYGSTGYMIEINTGSFSEFLPGTDSEDPNNTLPVELIYFKGVSAPNEVNLTWATSSEFNNDYFAIERSTDGKEFETIDEIYGAGTSNATIKYQSADRSPLPGLTYYRLKQVDFDGSFSYSEIVSIERTLETNSIVLNSYPNPAQDYLNLQVNQSLFAGQYSLEIFNINGAPIQLTHTTENDYVLRLNTSGLRSGLYVIRLSVGSQVILERFAK